jgi:hypothetical protein
MRPLRDVIRRRPRRILELEDGDFAVAVQQAESIEQRPKRVRVVIMVTKDPPEGREVVVQPLGIRKRLGPQWEEWRTYWEGPWTRLHEEMLQPGPNRTAFLPDEATLQEEARKAGARGARSVIRSTV